MKIFTRIPRKRHPFRPFLFLIFTVFVTSGVFAQPNPLPPGWDTYSNQGNPHGIIVMLEANPRINDIPIQPGDYIGAFYQDDYGELKCGGADFWLGDENIIFSTFQDDPDTPEKDGFGYGEVMHFKVFSYTTYKEYDADLVIFDSINYLTTNKWYPLGLSSIIDLACFIDFEEISHP